MDGKTISVRHADRGRFGFCAFHPAPELFPIHRGCFHVLHGGNGQPLFIAQGIEHHAKAKMGRLGFVDFHVALRLHFCSLWQLPPHEKQPLWPRFHRLWTHRLAHGAARPKKLPRKNRNHQLLVDRASSTHDWRLHRRHYRILGGKQPIFSVAGFRFVAFANGHSRATDCCVDKKIHGFVENEGLGALERSVFFYKIDC